MRCSRYPWTMKASTTESGGYDIFDARGHKIITVHGPQWGDLRSVENMRITADAALVVAAPILRDLLEGETK